MPPPRFGVFGLKVGRGHCRSILETSRARLAGVADPDKSRHAMVRDLGFDGPIHDTYEDLLAEEKLDAVCVALPVPLHYPATKAALEVGCHVICEKPPTTAAREAKTLVDLARKKGLQLTWRLQRRFRSDILAARKAILRGKLGKMHRIHVQYTHQSLPLIQQDKFRMLKEGGGVFFDIGVHSIDAIKGKRDLYIQPEHGVDLMKMIEGVVKSADTQREVKLL